MPVLSVRRPDRISWSARFRAGAVCALLLATGTGIATAGTASAADEAPAAVLTQSATPSAGNTAEAPAPPAPVAEEPAVADPAPVTEVTPAIPEPTPDTTTVTTEPSAAPAEPIVPVESGSAGMPITPTPVAKATTSAIKKSAPSSQAVSPAAAPLAAATAPVVTTQPAEQTVDIGTPATFTAHATGSPTPTVQWQSNLYPGGLVWSNLPGATSDSYTIAAVDYTISDHEYRAVFTNSAGAAASAPALLTVTTPPAPGTPSAVQNVTAKQTAPGQITITWEAPASQGTSPITNYGAGYGQKYWGNGVSDIPTTTFRMVFDDIDDGDYLAVAFAINDSGIGERVVLPVSVGDLPSAPRAVTATLTGPHQVTVTWTAPATEGYSPITGYDASYGPAALRKGGSLSATTRKVVYNDVPVGSYTVSVAATNVVGTGPSATAAFTIPAPAVPVTTTPSAPQHVSATQTGPHQITLTWQAPVSAGTSPITGYDAGYATAAYGNGGPVSATTYRSVFNDLPLGTYTASVAAVSAVGSSQRVFVPVTIVAARVAAVPAPRQAASALRAVPELAQTGAESDDQIRIALALLVLGAALTLVGRRRSTTR